MTSGVVVTSMGVAVLMSEGNSDVQLVSVSKSQ